MNTNLFSYNSFDSYRPIISTGIYGNSTFNYILCTTDNPCFLTLLIGTKNKFAGKINEQATHRLFCNTIVDVQVTDRIVSDNKTYNVLYINNCNSMEHHLEILLEQINDI